MVRASDLKGISDQDYIDFMVNEIDRLSAIYGTDPYSFLKLNTCSVPASSLMDDSEYNVMVFDLDYDSEHNPVYSGDIEKKSFRTLRATRDNLELTLKMSGSRLVVSKSGSGTYISDVVAAELVEEFESLEDVAREYVKTVRNANYGDIREIQVRTILTTLKKAPGMLPGRWVTGMTTPTEALQLPYFRLNLLSKHYRL